MTTQLTELYTTHLMESTKTLMTESSTIQLTESYTSLLTESSQDAKSIESTIINDSTEQINTVDVPCKDNTKIKNAQGECICDNLNGYYTIKYNDVLYNEQCYNIETKPKNFFLNKETNLFEMCYKNCQTCNIYGNEVMIMKIIALHVLVIIFSFQIILIPQIVFQNVFIIIISLYIIFIAALPIFNVLKNLDC